MNSGSVRRSYAMVLSLCLGAWLLCDGILKAAARLVLTSGPEYFFAASALPALLAVAQFVFLVVLSVRSFNPGTRFKHGLISFVLIVLFIRVVHYFR